METAAQTNRSMKESQAKDLLARTVALHESAVRLVVLLEEESEAMREKDALS